MASMQRLSLEQKTIIAKEFEYVMSSFNYLQVIAMMIYTVRTIIELNPSYNKYPDRFLSNYFGSSYFANGNIEKPVLIILWIVFQTDLQMKHFFHFYDIFDNIYLYGSSSSNILLNYFIEELQQ